MLAFALEKAALAPIPASLLGLFGPIRDLLLDPTVRRVLVDGPDRIHVQRAGPPRRLALSWPTSALEDAIAGLARRAGKPFDADSPCLEAVLRDGTRFLALRAPVVHDGPVLAITRPVSAQSGDALLRPHEAVAETLALAMGAGLNIAVVGPPGGARDALLQHLISDLPATARVVVIDDDEVLDVGKRPVVRLTPRKGDAEGRRAVSVGDLLYSAGRLEPDRVVVNQLRLHDGWDAVTLLAGRSAPVLMGLAGREPADGLAWLIGHAAASGPSGRERAVPMLVASGLDLVVTVDGGPAPRLLRIDQVSPGPQGPVLEPLHQAQPNGTLTTEPAHARFVVQWTRSPTEVLETPGEFGGEDADDEDAPLAGLDRDGSMAGAIRDALAAVEAHDGTPSAAPGAREASDERSERRREVDRRAERAADAARPLTRPDAPPILSSARIELPDVVVPARRAFPTVPTLSDVGQALRDEDSLDIAVDVPRGRPPEVELEATQALDILSPEVLAAMNLPDPELDELTSAERARPAGDPLRRLLASLEGSEEGNNTTGEIEMALDGLEEDEEEGEEETVIQRPATHRTFSEILRSLGRRSPPPAETTTEKPATRPRRSRTTLVRDEE